MRSPALRPTIRRVIAAVDDRSAKPSAVGELLDDRVGNDIRRLRRSGSGRRARPWADPSSSGPSTTSISRLARVAQRARRSLSSARPRDPSRRGRRPNSRCPRRSRARAGPAAGIICVSSWPSTAGAGKEAAVADRDRAVDIGERTRAGWAGTPRARTVAHRVEHGRIGHALRAQLAFDHRFARGGEIGNRASGPS